MKFNCGLSKAERELEESRERYEYFDKIGQWHRWYAWFPVRVGHKDCRWLEPVERRFGYDKDLDTRMGLAAYFDSYGWHYKALSNESTT